MRKDLDFTPLFRSTIGFDRVFELLENAAQIEPADNWPPYDIEKTDDDHYRITMAVAGFADNELSVTVEQNLLVVRGHKVAQDGGQYLHRSIAARPFERRFELADYVTVAGARFDNGLLAIELVRELPEDMKPRRVEISTIDALPKGKLRQIEGAKQVA